MYVIVNMTLRKLVGNAPLSMQEAESLLADCKKMFPECSFKIYYLFIVGD